MTANTTRNPLLALLASLLMPGLGQLYNGEATKGLLLFLGLGATTPVSAWLALHVTDHAILPLIILFLIIALAIYVYAIVDAYRSAKRIGDTYTLKALNQSYVYIIVFIVGYFFIFGGMLQYTRKHLIESYYIPSKSMLPSVLQGDYIFADKRVNCIGCKTQLKHGDLAIFVYPNNRNTLYIKRIIGLPGDDIDIKGMDIRVNTVPIQSVAITEFSHAELNRLLATHIAWREKCDRGAYAVIWNKDAKQENASFTVPNGQVFVMGDNRNATTDSRRFGTVPLADIVGIAKQVWFSRSSESGIRWWRMGVVIDPNYSPVFGN